MNHSLFWVALGLALAAASAIAEAETVYVMVPWPSQYRQPSVINGRWERIESLDSAVECEAARTILQTAAAEREQAWIGRRSLPTLDPRLRRIQEMAISADQPEPNDSETRQTHRIAGVSVLVARLECIAASDARLR
jgi:hypothetical protein